MEAYSQVKILGKGSFGSAWLIQRKKDGKQFVAKEVKIAKMKAQEKEAALNEITLLRTLNHPNITRYVDHFEQKGALFIVMEYANGGDLYSKIRGRRGLRLSEKEILHYFCQLCLALMHMHEQRVLHRDLKSQNVFLTQDGVVKLGDFGISTVLRNTYELKKTVCGTPYYFSPELCMNKPYNNKSDVWALGCILYELTTLSHAFEGNSMNALVNKILKGVYPPIHSGYSRDLGSLISSMLQTDPKKRPSIHQIVDCDFIRNALSQMKVSFEGAAKAKRSCVSEDEKRQAQAEAFERLAKEKEARVAKEKEDKGKLEQDKQVRLEARVQEKAAQLQQWQEQLARQEKEHEARLQRIKEQQQGEWQKRKELEDRVRQRAEEEKKYRAKREADNKLRERAWEQNMNAVQKQYQQPESSPEPQQQRKQEPGFDANHYAKMFRENRREAQANRLRILQDEKPQQEQRQVVQSPPMEEVVEQPQPRKKQMTEEEMDQARKEAYWQMRREAAANKQRLMQAQGVKIEVPIPKPNSQGPSSKPSQEVPKQADAKGTKPTEVFEPPAKKQQVERKTPTPPPASLTQVEVSSSSEDEETEEGYHKFLNNDAVVESGAVEQEQSREEDYRGVQDQICDALNSIQKKKEAVDDFEDPAEDAGKFVLEGQTLRLPNAGGVGDPLAGRIESLRLFLEDCLTVEIFIKVYRMMDGISAESEQGTMQQVEAMMHPSQHKYIPVVVQLIVCEDFFNEQQNR